MNTEEQHRFDEIKARLIRERGARCEICGRKGISGLTLHHETYEAGPEHYTDGYSDEFYRLVCKRCHAEGHGKILPQSGWTLDNIDDLGDTIGTCELCGQAIRYEYYISHPTGGQLVVGSTCVEICTQSSIAEIRCIDNAWKQISKTLSELMWELGETRKGIEFEQAKRGDTSLRRYIKSGDLQVIPGGRYANKLTTKGRPVGKFYFKASGTADWKTCLVCVYRGIAATDERMRTAFVKIYKKYCKPSQFLKVFE